MLNKTKIIVWEGVDASGKTSLMKKAAEILSEKGYRVISYKTPSLSPTGKFAREYGNRAEIDPVTRMLLFLANTSDDSFEMKKIIYSKHPDFFFIDRYYLCSIVYGFAYAWIKGGEVSRENFRRFLESIEKIGKRVFLKPDLYIIADVSEEDRKKRLERKESQGGLEEELERDEAMQRKVREFYKFFAEFRPREVLWILNAEGELEKNARLVVEKLLSR